MSSQTLQPSNGQTDMYLNPPALKTNRYSQNYKQQTRKECLILPQIKFNSLRKKHGRYHSHLKQFRDVKIRTDQPTCRIPPHALHLNIAPKKANTFKRRKIEQIFFNFF